MTNNDPEPSTNNRLTQEKPPRGHSNLSAYSKSPIFLVAILFVGMALSFIAGFGVASMLYWNPSNSPPKREVAEVKKPTTTDHGGTPKAQDPSQPDYADKIQIINVKAKHGQTYLGEPGAGVDIKVKNVGDRTASDLVITVFFLDADGNDIHEDDFPLASSSGTSRSMAAIRDWDLSPIKPNYIRQRNGVMSLNVPAEWKEGAVRAKVKSVTVE